MFKNMGKNTLKIQHLLWHKLSESIQLLQTGGKSLSLFFLYYSKWYRYFLEPLSSICHVMLHNRWRDCKISPFCSFMCHLTVNVDMPVMYDALTSGSVLNSLKVWWKCCKDHMVFTFVFLCCMHQGHLHNHFVTWIGDLCLPL